MYVYNHMNYLCTNLTLAKHCNERSIIFPTVSVSCFCDLNIMNNRMRPCLGSKLYQAQLYAVDPTIRLCKNKNNEE